MRLTGGQLGSIAMDTGIQIESEEAHIRVR